VPKYLTLWAWAKNPPDSDLWDTCTSCGHIVRIDLSPRHRCPACGFTGRRVKAWESADILGQLRTPKPPEGQ
jgi:hypothetical protein